MMRIAIIFFLLLLGAAPAEAHRCPVAEAQAAEQATDTLHSWRSIYTAFTRYKQCDDGAIAEGFSDKVVHLLATQWSSLHQAQHLIAKDRSFQSFIVRHVDATTDAAELKRVRHSATTRCPASAKLLCRQIDRAASER
jgi:hypothetical protein